MTMTSLGPRNLSFAAMQTLSGVGRKRCNLENKTGTIFSHRSQCRNYRTGSAFNTLIQSATNMFTVFVGKIRYSLQKEFFAQENTVVFYSHLEMLMVL